MYKGMLKVTKQSEQDHVSKSQVESATSTLSTKSLWNAMLFSGDSCCYCCWIEVSFVALASESQKSAYKWHVAIFRLLQATI